MAWIPRASEPRQGSGSLHKTVQCKFFELGLCNRGEDCTFAHGLSEIRGKPNFLHTRPCFDFMLKGNCANGNQCKYAHVAEKLNRSSGDSPSDTDMLNHLHLRVCNEPLYVGAMTPKTPPIRRKTSASDSASTASTSEPLLELRSVCGDASILLVPQPSMAPGSFSEDACTMPVPQPSMAPRSFSKDASSMLVPQPHSASRTFTEDVSGMLLPQPSLAPRSLFEDAASIPGAATTFISSLHPPLQPRAVIGGPFRSVPAWNMQNMKRQETAGWKRSRGTQQQLQSSTLTCKEIGVEQVGDIRVLITLGRMQQNLSEQEEPMLLARLSL